MTECVYRRIIYIRTFFLLFCPTFIFKFLCLYLQIYDVSVVNLRRVNTLLHFSRSKIKPET